MKEKKEKSRGTFVNDSRIPRISSLQPIIKPPFNSKKTFGPNSENPNPNYKPPIGNNKSK